MSRRSVGIGELRPRLFSWLGGYSPFLAFCFALALVAAFMAVFPLGRVLVALVYSEGQFRFGPLEEVLGQTDLGGLLWTTTSIVVASAILGLLVGGGLAWLNERTDARMGVVSDALPLVPYLIPPIAAAVGWVLLLSPRSGIVNSFLRDLLGTVGVDVGNDGPLNIYSWWGIVFVYALYQVPYAFLAISAGLRDLDGALEEQARICGASLWRTLRTVTLPALRPSTGAAVLLMFWFGLSLTSIPLIIAAGANLDILSVRIVEAIKFSYPSNMDLAVGLGAFVVLILAALWYLQVRTLRSSRFASVGGKRRTSPPIELGRLRVLARLMMLGYFGLAAALPLLGLVVVTLQGYWTSDISFADFNLDAVRSVIFSDRTSRTALQNSLSLGVFGATAGVFVAGIVAVWVRGNRSRISGFLDGAIKFPASVSNIVLAVGFLLAFAGPPFGLHGTWTILFIALLAVYMPQAAVAADSAAALIDLELLEAGSVSGGSPGRVFRKISLPMMVPGLLAGWVLLFVRLAGDVNVSVILSGVTNPVVGARIIDVYQGGSYAALAALSLLLTLASLILVMAALVVGRMFRRGTPTASPPASI